MHGRVKSIQREHEQQKTIEQRQEEVSKVRMYHEVASKVLEMKRQQLYEPSVLPLTSHLLLLNPEFHMLWSYRRQVITALAKKAGNSASKMQELAKIELEMTLVRDVFWNVARMLHYETKIDTYSCKRTHCNGIPNPTRLGFSESGLSTKDWEI